MGWKTSKILVRLRSDRLRFPIALAVGVALWGLSLPPYGYGILAVPAFIAILYVLPGERPGRVAAIGWAGGLAWQFVTLWWLIPTLVRYGNIAEPLALALVLGMCAVLGLYMAGFLGTLALVVKRWGVGGLLVAPFLWVLWEWLQGHLFTGFPWWGPGYALSLYPAFLQLTSLFGVLGLSFLAVLTAAAVALWLRNRRHPAALYGVPAALVLLLGGFLWGYRVSGRAVTPPPKEPVGYLQPQIPQNEKWDEAFATKIMRRMTDLSTAFKLYRLKLLVWPESSTPFDWDDSPAFRQRVFEIAGAIQAPVLVGSVLDDKGGYENGAILAMPSGRVGGRYAKTHLVPFGEYVPFRHLLFFAKPIVDTIGDFTPGHSLQPLETPAGRVGVTICYEGIFPGLVRTEVRKGAQLLVNMTNDAWYRGTPGPVQHFLLERVRAVETDRYLIRSANEGISGVVTPRGNLQAATTPGRAASFWGLVEARNTKTLWTRIGDGWLFVPLLVSLYFLVTALVPDRARLEKQA